MCPGVLGDECILCPMVVMVAVKLPNTYMYTDRKPSLSYDMHIHIMHAGELATLGCCNVSLVYPVGSEVLTRK